MSKKSFWTKLTGGEENELADEYEYENSAPPLSGAKDEKKDWIPVREESDGQLTVDVYQTPESIILETMVAGVRPDELSINITRDMVTIKGRRERSHSISDDNYFYQELYWGSFSRTILLPAEVDPDAAEAVEKHGFMVIRLPKIKKDKVHALRVKSV
ncbi:Hsp20/alpha crystallin family protein [bacterium]|nr:Hsp20/alpha crystallin family protein [bacterium]MCI0565626.1 Hsp20/alpha crystallin family protein [bacterium]MCI0680382.1 Hsp20/alpha crystallin family protein [bacterium]